MPDQNYLAGPPPAGEAQDQGSAPSPDMGGGQRPALDGFSASGLSRPGGEKIVFSFADGFKATETFRELLALGADKQAMGSVVAFIEDLADKVHSINRGGAPAMPMGGGPPSGTMGP